MLVWIQTLTLHAHKKEISVFCVITDIFPIKAKLTQLGGDRNSRAPQHGPSESKASKIPKSRNL